MKKTNPSSSTQVDPLKVDPLKVESTQKTTPPPHRDTVINQLERDVQASWQKALKIAQSIAAEGQRIKKQHIKNAHALKKQVSEHRQHLDTSQQQLLATRQQLIDTQQNLKLAHQNLHRSVRDFSNLQKKASRLRCDVLNLKHQKQNLLTNTTAPRPLAPALIFWRKIFMCLGVSAVALIFGVAFRQPLQKNMSTLKSQAIGYLKRPSASDMYMAHTLAQQREAIKFKPKPTPNIKNTYTDNILHTTRYMNFETTNKKAWLLHATRYLVEQLEIDEATVAQALGKEAALISTLVDLKKSIDNRQPHIGISKMRRHEQEFNATLEKWLGPRPARKFKQLKLEFARQHTS